MAEKLLAQATFPPATQTEAHYQLAQTYANKGNLSQAQHHGLQAKALSPLHRETQYLLAVIAENQGQLSTAIDYLKTAIYLNNNDPLPHFNLAILYHEQNKISTGPTLYQ